MEMQAYIRQYTNTDADKKSSRYSQGFTNSDPAAANDRQTHMRILFSGYGKAEKNMGMAAIPPLVQHHHSFTPK